MPDFSKKIYSYLNEMVELGASDLYLTVDQPRVYRIKSDLVKQDEPAKTSLEIENIIKDFLNDIQLEEYTSTFELNLALSNKNDERFRVNLFYQQANMGLVARHIKSKIPSFEELKIPDSYKEFVMKKRGLFFMVGSTGSGKSTSLASMLEYRNQEGSGHVITVEDPIEYVFKQRNCIFTQREINIDTYSYGMALKNALRQAPDVIFIGEIRDRASMESAITFSETGHLVLATIHANNANQTFERILGFYPEEVHRQILISLSHNLVAIAGQRLIRNVSGDISLAYEIMKNEGLITDLIKEGSFAEIKDVINKNLNNGMMSFDECLYKMFRQKLFDKETVLKEADNPNNLRLRISQYSDVNLGANLSGVPKTSLTDEQLSNYTLNKKDDF